MTLGLPPLAAEKIFEISGWPITNSYINSSLTAVLFVVFGFLINRGVRKYYGNHPLLTSPLKGEGFTVDSPRLGEQGGGETAPRGVLNFFESVLELLLGFVDNVTKDKKKSLKFLPIVGALFFFILVSNWMGLLPGTGTIGVFQLHQGKVELIPFLRPANTDLNMTLAMAVFAVIGSHILGVAAIGFFKYANKFIKLADIYLALKSLSPIKIFTAVIEFFVGVIEIFSEVAKMVSLSLRLFGNIFAGEVLLTVLAGLIAFIVPLPFMALELLVGFIQATVFAMLTLVYLTMATAEVHGHGEGKEHHETAKEHG
ncbi:MAG: F0F1 ATP synthase subunit A [Candidatus Doudnabacteria bacterium]|nr:F0F1 ATP synthase subunit A [Candidatus Doudnabacteria bacterium]